MRVEAQYQQLALGRQDTMQFAQHLVRVIDKFQSVMSNYNVYAIALQRYFTGLANQVCALPTRIASHDTVVNSTGAK